MKNHITTVMITGLLACSAGASAAISITQGSSATTYTTMLNFDEPGGPVGSVSPDAWQSIGITSLAAGDGNGIVNDWATATAQPWLGVGNSLLGNFGVFINFASDLEALSFQAWDPSGVPSPFGGGFGVFLFDDGVEVGSTVVEPAYGGFGDEWYDIVASGGSAFDEVRLVGFGFAPETFVDNLSWNVAPVPVPGALLLFASALTGLGFTRRRKAA